MDGAKLTHSQSQPGGMDRTPPGTPKKGGKMLAFRVQMLDDSVTMFQIQAKALGRVLFDQVCKQLHLLESDYFGLEYQEIGGTRYWLDLEKPLSRQIGLSLVDTLLRFCVKFYTPDPSQLEEEFTRYLFCLQIKRDLSQGLLQCNDNTAALMASYLVQAECSDYVAEDYPDHRYLSSFKFVPNQDQELERRIMENHKKHAGQSPAEADLNLLETARRCELYGIKMHAAKDHEGVPLNLAVAHMGIVVFQNYTKINTFSWAKIRKISFKRKRFLVKLHPEGYGYYKDTVEFFFEGRNECKNFWKKSVENHGFFRCSMVKRVPRLKTRVLSRGSSFRYSGRTQKQIVEFVRENYVKRQTFQRSQSFRHSSSAHSSVANVGASISAHPLLPLGDNAVAGTPASLSCGSMTLTSSPLHAADIHAAASPSPPLTTSVSPGTSVTSSPQHFYPRETPYRHQAPPSTKEKPAPQGPSAPTASLPRSQSTAPTSLAVTTTAIQSASLSNAGGGGGGSGGARTPDYSSFNDVYSNCYDSLRNLRLESEQVEVVESDWERSMSCKDLKEDSHVGYDSPVTRYDDSLRACYTALTSKVTSADVETKLFSSSYPGTTSSMSAESVVGDVIETNDSQEDVALSHDDLSHDSYELLERDLDDSMEDSARSKNRRGVSDSDRTRSCSWGSERGLSPLDSKSCEKLASPVENKANSRSLERGKSPKHKSEGDFRSLDRKSPKNSKVSLVRVDERKHSLGGRRKSKELLEYDTRNYAYEVHRRSREIEDEVFRTPERISPLDSRAFSPKALEEKELIRSLEREARQRKRSKEYDQDSSLERRRHQERRRSSREELELFVMDSEEEYVREERRRKREKREREERFHEGIKEKEQEKRRRSIEEEKLKRNGKRMEDEWRKRSREQLDELKKHDRSVSNQFGRYSEFLKLDQDYELMMHERKVLENYEKVCEVSRMAKELERHEKAALILASPLESPKVEFLDMAKKDVIPRAQLPPQFKEFNAKTKGGVVLGFRASPKSSPKLGAKAPIERTKSDPFDSKNLRRNVLTHQKSIDVTPLDSENTTSDYDNEDISLKLTSRSEHDIPYTLHKRHCMNGTAKDPELKTKKSNSTPKKASLEEPKPPRSIPTSPKLAEAKRSGIEIINLDDHEPSIIVTPKKMTKPTVAKKPASPAKRSESPKITKPTPKPVKRELLSPKTPEPKTEEEIAKEPIYAVVNKAGKVSVEEKAEPTKKVPPEPPKRGSSVTPKPPERVHSLVKSPSGTLKKTPPEPPKRTTSVPKLDTVDKSPEPKASPASLSLIKSGERKEEVRDCEIKKVPVAVPVKPKPLTDHQTLPSIVPHKREESLILFARTRLGLSEGSAFTPVTRQGHVGSPTSQRRTKSLDAPVVSLHRLPPVDAFSSKDDTVDAVDDVVKSAAARAAEFFRVELKQVATTPPVAKGLSTDSEVDTIVPEDLEIEKNFKATIESQSKFELSFTDEKVLDGVRSKRLLSKIDSVDAIDSEGDLDSSKHTEPLRIPLDRIVPESVRFPSVRQLSGQTSEESADGWDPKEVKVKRRTPRRSTGRDESDFGILESVVWDSKDDEQQDDDVWDDSMVYTNPCVITDAVVAQEYLKRGSCGQSIDDDNLSTPMKESSPEHWVSVDDLPEAIEREAKLLRAQEKILREKILNEKIKIELNLDTIDVNDRIYRDSFQSSFEDPPLPVLPKEKFKGHSLDTYELTEKKLRERCAIKNPSLDEHILRDEPTSKDSVYLNISSNLDISDKSSSYENVPKVAKDQRAMNSCIKCKVVSDVNEIDQFEDNDEDLEEFVVVLDETRTNSKGSRESWDSDGFRRTVSKEESLISVPEEFKDVEEEEVEVKEEIAAQVEIRLDNGSHRPKTGEEHLLESQLLEEKLKSMADDAGRLSPYNGSRRSSDDPRRLSASDEPGRLSPFDGSRRGSDDNRRLSASEDTGRLSPYDCSSRRSSDDPLRLSVSDDTGRLSPFDDSRRGSEDPRRLSTSEDSRRLSASEDSRRYSMSEDSRRLSTSVSEETRRRLSSTEETRRKRASLTKQCSVGVDSLSDDMIPGIQECSSSFEQDEKDVFDSVLEPPITVEAKSEETAAKEEISVKEVPSERSDIQEIRKLEIEVSEDASSTDNSKLKTEDSREYESDSVNHLAPPTREPPSSRELSRETEDSMDYGEGDFKEIREVVKEKDISDGLICDNASTRTGLQSSKLPSSFEKSESSEGDELRFIDDKRGNTPEMIVGKGKATAAMSVVIVNEGIAVLDKIVEQDRLMQIQTLPRTVVVADRESETRHTLPKRGAKPKPAPKPEYVHRKLTKAIPNLKIVKPKHSPIVESKSLADLSQDSSQESDLDRLCEVSLIAQIQSQIARRNLSEEGKQLRRDTATDVLPVPIVKIFQEVEQASKDEKLLWRQRTSLEEEENEKQTENTQGEEVKVMKKAECDKKSPEQEKRDSGEDMSSSSSAPPNPKRELSSTWRPFLLESSGSSSLEEGWLPPDDNAHLADEEETSSTSNNQQDDSLHDDVIDYPVASGYPVLSMSNAEMLVGGYNSVFSLSRTLSRISERSTTSEQERSDVEDDITKPSSHSVSVEEESILSSDHQPSLSSDPPSPKASATKIPDLPQDQSPIPDNFLIPEDKTPVCEPFGDFIPPPLADDDWPSPPTSSSMFDTPVVSHVETFYMEIHPEEACKVVVVAERHEENSSSDENPTLHEDNLTLSTTTTTQDGTVIIPVRPRNLRNNSMSEDTSDWSRNQFSASDEIPSENLGSRSEWQPSTKSGDTSQAASLSDWSSQGPSKSRPPRLKTPPADMYELPTSKVRSPTSAVMYTSLRSPTSHSETSSPKNHGRFFGRSSESPTRRCTPYYSNMAEHHERSYFDRYDTGSLDRTKVTSARKCQSYYSVIRVPPSEDDSSSNDAPPQASSNTIPRTAKRPRRRHRVAMDLQIRDGAIVSASRTKTSYVENSDSEHSSSPPRRKQSEV